MSRNKINFNLKTKLTNSDTTEAISSIITSVEASRTKSFRFRAIDRERLSKIRKSLNEYSSTKRFNETDIIRGLLVAGEKISEEKLILYLRESFA